jgi:integrase
MRYDVALTDSNGKLYWTTCQSKKEARRIRTARTHEKDEGRGLVANSLTVSDLSAQYLESLEAQVASGKLRPSTLASVKQNVSVHLNPKIGRQKLKDFQVRHVYELIDTLRKGGLAESTNRLAVDTLGRILSFGKKRGLVAQNVCRDLERGDRPSSKARGKAKPIEPEELTGLLKAAHEAWRLVFLVAAYSGLRQGEILGLRWTDIDFETGRIHVQGQLARGGEYAPTKSGAGIRTVEILAAPVMHELRKAYLAASDKSGYVFVTEDGRPRHHHVALETFKSACRRAKIGERKFHDLRHTFASLLISEGFDPVYVASQMGHAKPSLTLDTYSHLYAKHRRTEQARESLGASALAVLG